MGNPPVAPETIALGLPGPIYTFFADTPDVKRFAQETLLKSLIWEGKC